MSYTMSYSGADYVMDNAELESHVTLTTTGTASGTFTVSGSGPSSRTITISNIGGVDGTIGILISQGTASDLAGNVAAGTGPSATFTVDNGSGDLNGDGIVNMIDAMMALRIAAGLDTPTAAELAHCDVAPLVNGVRVPDGKVDLDDVVAILRKSAGLPSW